MSPNDFHYDSGDDPITKRDVDRIIDAVVRNSTSEQPIRDLQGKLAKMQANLGCITAMLVALLIITAGIGIKLILR